MVSKMKTRRSQHGFSLVELVVVVVIAGIAMAIAVPSIESFLANQRMKTASFNLVVAMMNARSEAQQRGMPVFVKSLPSTGLQGGWCIQIDNTQDCSLSVPPTSALRLQEAVTGVTYTPKTGAGVTGVTVSGGMATFTFNRSGRMSSAVRVDIVDDRLTNLKRCVYVETSGNARSEAGQCP